MKKDMSAVREPNLDRMNAFSDAVFAIIITIMILDLKRPEDASFSALARQWHIWVSYLVSYLFIAIVWVNHQFLSRYAVMLTPRLLWANLGHMFSVALIPFLTAWIAETRLAPVPVALYAFIFFLVNVTYLILVYETLCNEGNSISYATRKLFHFRSVITMVVFLVAMVLAFSLPQIGFLLICCCLLFYIKPNVPNMQAEDL